MRSPLRLAPLLVAVAFLASCLDFPEAKPYDDGTWGLTIGASVDGAEVYVDGALKGFAPVALRLMPGEYRVTVKAPEYKDWTRVVDLRSHARLDARLESIYPLVTFRVGKLAEGTLFVDGAARGRISETAPVAINLPEGVHQVSLDAEGFAPLAFPLSVTGPAAVNLDLKPLVNSLELRLGPATPGVRAAVRVNGEPKGETPLSLSLPTGVYKILFSAPGYLDRTESVTLKGPRVLAVDLEVLKYPLSIATNVPGARVYVDGVLAGTAPGTFDIPGGPHSIRLTSPGLPDWNGKLELTRRTELYAELALPRHALVVTLPPDVAGAEAFLDGASLGTFTPARPLRATAAEGAHDLAVKAPGYAEWTAKIALDKDLEIFAPLVAAEYTATIYVEKGAVKAQVYVDGVLRGTTPLRLVLPAGEHAIRLVAEGYATKEDRIVLAGDRDFGYAMVKATVTVALTVESSPPGAALYIDGKLVGVTPATVNLAPGPHEYYLSAMGYRDLKGTVNVDGPQKLALALSPATSVGSTLTLDFPGAFLFSDEGEPLAKFRLYIDGSLVKTRDFRAIPIAPGKRRIAIVSGGIKAEILVDIEAGTDYLLSASAFFRIVAVEDRPPK